jgi:hypothetical protein
MFITEYKVLTTQYDLNKKDSRTVTIERETFLKRKGVIKGIRNK